MVFPDRKVLAPEGLPASDGPSVGAEEIGKLAALIMRLRSLRCSLVGRQSFSRANGLLALVSASVLRKVMIKAAVTPTTTPTTDPESSQDKTFVP